MDRGPIQSALGDVTSVDQAAIRRAADLIRAHVRRTPIIEADGGELGISGGQLTLKLELMQHTGSFKPRGAFANLLSRDVPAAGVVAASGGNHGAAVAYAAQKLGVTATIFVPEVASRAKVMRIKSYGAELLIGGARYADALAAAEDYQAKTGALAVHAYDQPETLLGQGTLAMELEEQARDLDTLLVAVGGGGLIGGVLSWYESRVRVVAVEPETAPTLSMALAAGRPVDAPAGGIAADSLAPKKVGELMFPIAQKHLAQSVLVTDAAIADAQRVLWDRLRIAAEPGGATAFAALLSERYRPQKGERIGVLICGGNTDAVSFPK